MYDHLPKTRAEAIKLRVHRYFTGNPCVHGHISPRRTLNFECIGCARAHIKARRKAVQLILAEANAR